MGNVAIALAKARSRKGLLPWVRLWHIGKVFRCGTYQTLA